MEIKIGGIYKVKSDVFAEDAVLKKATMVKVLRIDAFCFTQMAMVSEFTEKEIKGNITLDSVIWYISSDNLEEVENVEKTKNLASNEQKKMEIAMAFHDKYTTAYLIKEGNIVKQETARCAPDDKFNIETGSKLALERLFEKKDVSETSPSTHSSTPCATKDIPLAELEAMEQEVSKRVAEIQHDAREDLEKDKNIIRKIADHYGPAHQGNKLMEEIGELITASAKPDVDHFVEEMADVAIMIEQVVYLLKKENLFAETREKKIDRQIKRIKKEEEQGRDCWNCRNLFALIGEEPCISCYFKGNWEKNEK